MERLAQGGVNGKVSAERQNSRFVPEISGM